MDRPSKIICFGQNYVSHVSEMGSTPPGQPLFCLKAPSSLIGNGEAIVLPESSEDVQYEGELAVVVGQRCRGHLSRAQIVEVVAGFAVANDVTARDIQRRERLWTRSKSFDTFCAVGPVTPLGAGGFDPDDFTIRTFLNGHLVQDGSSAEMIFSVADLVRFVALSMTLEVGDLILTGTPSGVGRLAEGDDVTIEIPGLMSLSNRCSGQSPAPAETSLR